MVAEVEQERALVDVDDHASRPAERAGLRVGDLLLTAGGQEVATAQDLQRLMFAEAIGHPLQVTVMRNGALVDVIAEPTERVAA